MRKPDYTNWLSRDIWTLGEFVLLVFGFDPDVEESNYPPGWIPDDPTWQPGEYIPVGKLNDLAQRSITAGILKTIDSSRFKRAARPVTFIRWAIDRGVNLPEEMASFEATCDHNLPEDRKELAKLSRQAERKRETADRNKRWKAEHQKLRKQYPNKSKSWYAMKISKLPIGADKQPETIRKVLGKRN